MRLPSARPFPGVSRMSIQVRILPEVMDPAASLAELCGRDSEAGAISSFIGQVRSGDDLIALELEHYPGVTEAALEGIAQAAMQRWSLTEARIIHRVGRMEVGEPIVLVAAAAPHRRAALAAVEFMIDVLKTQAPFWKKEYTRTGSHWIEPRDEDHAAAEGWLRSTQDQAV